MIYFIRNRYNLSTIYPAQASGFGQFFDGGHLFAPVLQMTGQPPRTATPVEERRCLGFSISA